MVFDTIILGSNPSAPAKNKMLFSINIIKKIKEIIFPFYKSKELKKIFSLMSKDVPKNKQVAMFVGGCVRNYLNNKKIDDIDIATILSPSEIKEKFKNSDIRIIDTGIEHGSLTLIYNKCKFEITTLRKDVKTDGRHAEILLTDSWLEDSNRRDITINSIYLDNRGKIYDPHSGVDDLKNNVVKFIGDPNVRIQEDYLRIIRFLRFAIQYDSSIDVLNHGTFGTPNASMLQWLPFQCCNAPRFGTWTAQLHATRTQQHLIQGRIVRSFLQNAQVL